MAPACGVSVTGRTHVLIHVTKQVGGKVVAGGGKAAVVGCRNRQHGVNSHQKIQSHHAVLRLSITHLPLPVQNLTIEMLSIRTSATCSFAMPVASGFVF